MKQVKLMQGDNIESLKKLPDNSVDSIVSDPPYGLSFMNKKWDYDVPSVDFWKEVLRVLKPGGHVLSFGGTRTYHRMVVNIEDAGFEIRDQIMWIYGSGFPKSHNIGKSFDKKSVDITKGQSQYEGWGTALKPANEPICLARKPLSEKTIVNNVIKWGVGGINIDGCRIDTNGEKISVGFDKSFVGFKEIINDRDYETNKEGRFPANIIFDEEAAAMLDEQQINTSRFFYVPKVGKKERNMGLDNFDNKERPGQSDTGLYSSSPYCIDCGKTINGTNNHSNCKEGLEYKPSTTITKNNHPTLKPINLMTYLCRLVTPPGGIILDPFMGSGSTGIAACLEGFRFIGMELDEDYFKIAEARVNNFDKYRDILK